MEEVVNRAFDVLGHMNSKLTGDDLLKVTENSNFLFLVRVSKYIEIY